jgi:succinoglycan biosynthesis transport protein ExoP
MAHSSEILASDGLRTFFKELRQQYDCVVVDLPPVAPIVDVRSTGGLVDSYIFVVEWARTKMEVAQLALSKAAVVNDNLLGVVLNKVDFKILSRHEGHRSEYYSEKYYAQYGDNKST